MQNPVLSFDMVWAERPIFTNVIPLINTAFFRQDVLMYLLHCPEHHATVYGRESISQLLRPALETLDSPYFASKNVYRPALKRTEAAGLKDGRMVCGCEITGNCIYIKPVFLALSTSSMRLPACSFL